MGYPSRALADDSFSGLKKQREHHWRWPAQSLEEAPQVPVPPGKGVVPEVRQRPLPALLHHHWTSTTSSPEEEKGVGVGAQGARRHEANECRLHIALGRDLCTRKEITHTHTRTLTAVLNKGTSICERCGQLHLFFTEWKPRLKEVNSRK